MFALFVVPGRSLVIWNEICSDVVDFGHDFDAFWKGCL